MIKHAETNDNFPNLGEIDFDVILYKEEKEQEDNRKYHMDNFCE